MPVDSRKLRGRLVAMRRSLQKGRDLEAVAKALGRRLVKRGKEPVWESTVFPSLRPQAIPRHGGKDPPKGTRNSVISQLEADVSAWEERLLENDDDGTQC